MRYERVEPTSEDFAKAQELLDAGYYQTSSAFRYVTLLPTGVTPQQLLYRGAMSEISEYLPNYAYWKRHYESWASRFTDAAAADHYLRCHAPSGNHVQLTIGQFTAFRQLGGRSAHDGLRR